MNTNSDLDLQQFKGFLLDVDGVLVRDKDLIPGAVQAVERLQETGLVLYLSNNSMLSRSAYARKLSELGFKANEANIVNSGYLAAEYIRQREPEARVFIIGGSGLREELQGAGLRLVEQDAAWMVNGLDRHFNYDTLAQGLRVLDAGARWVATGLDGTYPTPNGLLPGAGSMVGAFRGMGFEPEVAVGKPSLFCMQMALDHLAVANPEQVLVIGDRLDTDIAGAKAVGAKSLLVLSGVTSEHQLSQSDLKPSFVLPSLQELV